MNQRHAAGDGGLEPELRVVRHGQMQQLGPVRGQQHLVGRDDAGALLQRAPHPAAGRIDAADDFDHRVGLRREEFVDVLGPCHRRRAPSRRACVRRRD